MLLGRIRYEILALWIIGIVVIAGVPLVTGRFVTYEWANVGIFVIALIGLNLLTGYNGQISLGNGAFMAVGGYTTAIAVHRTGIPYAVTIPLAGLVAAAVGFAFGFPALRLSVIGLALATFGLALASPPLIKNFGGFTGGHDGIFLKPAEAPFGIDLSNEQWLYYLCWGIAGLLFLFARAMVGSRTGRAWMAIRDSETAAQASGLDLTFYKVLAFSISAFYAGIAGSLLAIATAYVNPDSFDLPLSLALLVGAVVGGLGTSLGPLVGAAFVVWAPEFAQNVPGGRPDIAYGLFLILIVFLAPSGAMGLVYRGWIWYLKRRGSVREEVIEVAPILDSAPPPEKEGAETGVSGG